MIIDQKTTGNAIDTSMVKIPIVWNKTICGSKARIVYDERYGIIDISSIPKAVVKITIKNNQIFLYSDKRFRKDGITCLLFKRC